MHHLQHASLNPIFGCRYNYNNHHWCVTFEKPLTSWTSLKKKMLGKCVPPYCNLSLKRISLFQNPRLVFAWWGGTYLGLETWNILEPGNPSRLRWELFVRWSFCWVPGMNNVARCKTTSKSVKSSKKQVVWECWKEIWNMMKRNEKNWSFLTEINASVIFLVGLFGSSEYKKTMVSSNGFMIYSKVWTPHVSDP